MKLSTKGRYAVMAMADLARFGGKKPVSLGEIAGRQEISLSYLEQLFAKLRKAGIVKSVRGPGGGYHLARDPDDILISDIILSVDEPIKATRCRPGAGEGCLGNGTRCITHDLWDELSRQIHLFLSAVTLGDVINRRVLGRSGVFGDMTPDIAGSDGADAPVSGQRPAALATGIAAAGE